MCARLGLQALEVSDLVLGIIAFEGWRPALRPDTLIAVPTCTNDELAEAIDAAAAVIDLDLPGCLGGHSGLRRRCGARRHRRCRRDRRTSGISTDARHSPLAVEPGHVFTMISEKVRANTVEVLTECKTREINPRQALIDLAQGRVLDAMIARGFGPTAPRIPSGCGSGRVNNERAVPARSAVPAKEEPDAHERPAGRCRATT